jgi:hypothetical protein
VLPRYYLNLNFVVTTTKKGLEKKSFAQCQPASNRGQGMIYEEDVLVLFRPKARSGAFSSMLEAMKTVVIKVEIIIELDREGLVE